MQKDIDEVVAAIKEEMRLYDADKEDRQLRSYEIQVFSVYKGYDEGLFVFYSYPI